MLPSYFVSRLELWLLALREHRHVSSHRWLVRTLDHCGTFPIFIREGFSWGRFSGLLSGIVNGSYQRWRLSRLYGDKDEADFFNGFSLDDVFAQAVKLKVTSRNIHVWIIANKEKRSPYVYMHRIINPAQRSIDHKLMTFHSGYRHGGGAGRILAKAVSFYHVLGITKITIVAGLSGGGALWPKAGFVPLREEEDQIISKISQNLSELPDRIKSSFNQIYGRDLKQIVEQLILAKRPHWLSEVRRLGDHPALRCGGLSLGAQLLNGTRWKGYLDLTDPVSTTQLDDYVAESRKKG